MSNVPLIRRLAEVPDSRLRQIDARVKLAVTFTLLVALAFVPHTRFVPFGRVSLLLLVVAGAGRVPPGAVLVRLLPLLPFTLAVLLIPFLHTGTAVLELPLSLTITVEGLTRAGGVLVRMGTFGGIMALLATTTPLEEILKALHAFRVPAGLVYGMGFTFRYLFLLFDEGQRMHRAYVSRGGELRPAALARQSLGTIVGVLFLRAYERGERVHRAMCARGFDTFAPPAPAPWPAGAQIAGGAVTAATGVLLSLPGVAGG